MNNFAGSSRWIWNIWFKLNYDRIDWTWVSHRCGLKADPVLCNLPFGLWGSLGCRTARNLVSTFHLFWSALFAIFFQTVFYVQRNADYLSRFEFGRKWRLSRKWHFLIVVLGDKAGVRTLVFVSSVSWTRAIFLWKRKDCQVNNACPSFYCWDSL